MVLLQVGTPVGDGYAGDRRARPQGHLGVAVLADDVGVHVLHRHAASAAEQHPKPAAVEHGAAADHTLRRKSADVHRGPRHHVDRVGHHDEQGVRRAGGEHRQHLAAHGDIRGGQIEAGLAGFLPRSRGENDDVRPGTSIEVVGPVHSRHAGERHAVREVQRLRLGPGPVQVVQYQLVADAPQEAHVGGRHAHASPHQRWRSSRRQ